ncbi:predicted protein [Botrytis cinerea T4]|uniref:Uncharacterized protein n=1 Tax=Botryotinia fuckeliana (strain T4) TaxID=999810 RepID=G2YF88_BOTF4|nr:predicted protein [Botrytis cinerea T4]
MGGWSTCLPALKKNVGIFNPPVFVHLGFTQTKSCTENIDICTFNSNAFKA